MRTKYIIGNWKMHTTAVVAAALSKAIVDGVGNEEHIGIILCPPFTYLALVCDVLKGSHVSLGAQNLYPEKAHSRARSARPCSSTSVAPM